MISLDTTIFQQIAQSIQAAANETEEAAGILNQIVTHDNWGCKERVMINEYIISNRNKINTLMQSSRNFSNEVTSAASNFMTAESGISDLFGQVEAVLAQILSVSGVISGSPAMVTHDPNAMIGSEVFTSIVDFSNIEIGMSAGGGGTGAFGSGSGGGGFR